MPTNVVQLPSRLLVNFNPMSGFEFQLESRGVLRETDGQGAVVSETPMSSYTYQPNNEETEASLQEPEFATRQEERQAAVAVWLAAMPAWMRDSIIGGVEQYQAQNTP